MAVIPSASNNWGLSSLGSLPSSANFDLASLLQSLANPSLGYTAQLANVQNPLANLETERMLNQLSSSDLMSILTDSNRINQNTTMYTAQQLARDLGLADNLQSMEQSYLNAADAGIEVRDQQFRNAANTFYQGIAAQGNENLQALRRAQAGSQASNATSGMASANILSAILGAQQGSSGDALQVAQTGAEFARQSAADRTKALTDALTAYNKLKLDTQSAANEGNSNIAANLAVYAGLGQTGVGAQSARNDRTANAIANMNEANVANAQMVNNAKAAKADAQNSQALQALSALAANPSLLNRTGDWEFTQSKAPVSTAGLPDILKNAQPNTSWNQFKKALDFANMR